MARITFKGLTEYEMQLSKLENRQEIRRIAGKATFEGAKTITDEIRENIRGLSARSDKTGFFAYQEKTAAPLTETAKQGLLDGLGIAELQDDNGFLNVKVGFAGYNKMKTKQYPKGQPNVLIARVTESGSSLAKKQPFVRPAIQNKRDEAERKMAQVVDEEISKLMK